MDLRRGQAAYAQGRIMSPFDNDLVDFACAFHEINSNFQAPERIDENIIGRKSERYFSRTNDGKLILRKVLSNYVPESYAWAPKQVFRRPMGAGSKERAGLPATSSSARMPGCTSTQKEDGPTMTKTIFLGGRIGVCSSGHSFALRRGSESLTRSVKIPGHRMGHRGKKMSLSTS